LKAERTVLVIAMIGVIAIIAIIDDCISIIDDCKYNLYASYILSLV
jgi:hypothetical protein